MRFWVPAMACCLPSRDQAPANHILDVEQILQDYVWSKFKASRPGWQQLCLRRKDFLVDVPMNYFHFDKIEEEVRPRQKPGDTPLPTGPQPSLVTQGMTHLPREVISNPLVARTNVMALSTDFTNCTTLDQTYTFRFEKTRKASLSVTFQKGFTVGGKVNFSLGLPKMVSDGKVGGEVDMHVTVSKATGEMIEETLTWEATSEIKVAKSSNYTAKVLLSEAPVSYNFSMLTKMSMPTGGAPATVRRRRKRSGEGKSGSPAPGAFCYTMEIHNLELVFKEFKGVKILKQQLGKEPVPTYSVLFKTTGIIDGIRLSNQKILLEEREPPETMRGGPYHHQYHHHPASSSSAASSSSSSHGHFSQVHHGYLRHGDVITEVTSDGYHHGDGYLTSSGAGGVGGPTLTSRGAAGSGPAGRMLALASSGSYSSSSSPSYSHHPHPHPHHPSPIPIIEELPEEDGGVGECGGGGGGGLGSGGSAGGGGGERDYPSPLSRAPSGPVRIVAGTPPHAGPEPVAEGPQQTPVVPRITTTAPSPGSQASSPLSDTGSPDMSESSKKSETITTV